MNFSSLQFLDPLFLFLVVLGCPDGVFYWMYNASPFLKVVGPETCRRFINSDIDGITIRSSEKVKQRRHPAGGEQ